MNIYRKQSLGGVSLNGAKSENTENLDLLSALKQSL